MSLTDIILTIIIQSLFCLGIRTLLSDGQILGWLREPFVTAENSKLMTFLRLRLQKRALINPDDIYIRRKVYAKISSRLSYILKPLLLCVVCFSSIWGGAAFIFFHGFTPIELIICCTSTAFILKFVNDKVDW